MAEMTICSCHGFIYSLFGPKKCHKIVTGDFPEQRVTNLNLKTSKYPIYNEIKQRKIVKPHI